MYCQLLQLLMILLAVLLRQLYTECHRPQIKNFQWFDFGDRCTILLSVGLGGWAMIELWLIQVWGHPAPSAGLIDSLRLWLWVSSLLPLSLSLLWGCRIACGDWLVGMGRGCLSFGLPIALLALLCWFSWGS
jgi:hypothetical protein